MANPYAKDAPLDDDLLHDGTGKTDNASYDNPFAFAPPRGGESQRMTMSLDKNSIPIGIDFDSGTSLSSSRPLIASKLILYKYIIIFDMV